MRKRDSEETPLIVIVGVCLFWLLVGAGVGYTMGTTTGEQAGYAEGMEYATSRIVDQGTHRVNLDNAERVMFTWVTTELEGMEQHLQFWTRDELRALFTKVKAAYVQHQQQTQPVRF